MKKVTFIVDSFQSPLTVDHQTKIIDAAEKLILLGRDYAFVKKDKRVIGIVCLNDLSNEYYYGVESEASIEKLIAPFYLFNENNKGQLFGKSK